MAAVYKKGQGYWTRLMSGIGYGTVVLMGAAWLAGVLRGVRIGDVQPIYVSAAGAVLLTAVLGWLGYWLIGLKPRMVDFMIATEGEMKKVNWSTRREILGSTWVVIGMTVLVGFLCFLFDQGFILFFRAINVLEGGA
jgi:preprotein translocase SecE subunit